MLMAKARLKVPPWLSSLLALLLLAKQHQVVAVLDALQPNILFILADDLSFNDVSFHGSHQVPTPNIDKIAAEGVVLNNYHVQPVCSPTRASILSGRHVIHTGIYMPFEQGTSLRLNLSYTLLPQYLKKLGYATYMVGKWHLGQNELAALPIGRGFDKYFGYWSGAEDYYTHSTAGAYDLADGTHTAAEYNGTYSTHLWTSKAVEYIEAAADASPRQPFFLLLAYQNVHIPLQAPKEYLERFARSTGGNTRRQAICAMTSVMDESIGNVTAALRRRGIYEDTLIVFSSDNGGPTHSEQTWASNFPMRGGKNTLWEGGTRAAAAVRGPGIHPDLVGKVSYAKVHASDWLRTLTTAASGDPGWFEANIPKGEPPLQLGDGMDVWEAFRSGRPVRAEILLETHKEGSDILHGHGLIVGDWKLLLLGSSNPPQEQGWYAPPGQDPRTVSFQLPCDLRKQPLGPGHDCTENFCLFNVTADPCEYQDLAAQFPEIVEQLRQRLADFQASAVELITEAECGCNPIVRGGAWRPCDDHTQEVASGPPTHLTHPPRTRARPTPLSASGENGQTIAI